MNLFTEDLRPLLFDGAPWFRELEESTPNFWVLWRITKSPEPAWWRQLLIAAAVFARDHGLLGMYRSRLAGIAAHSLSDTAGRVGNRPATSPIWEIASELVVGSYLERALGWEYLRHGPRGHSNRVGDWEFRSPTGKTVFVEVKSLVEPELYGKGVFSRGVASGRLTSVLRGAYRQLPQDGRGTLVVVVGRGLVLSVSSGIMHGDLFQTLFGRMQVTFNVQPYVEGSERMGPAFYGMFTHAGKHRRLGCVAGLQVGGLDTPGLGFYAIHNPFAEPTTRLVPEDFGDARQFWVDAVGRGEETKGTHPNEHWRRIVSYTPKANPCNA